MLDRNAALLLALAAIFGSSFLFMRVAAPEAGPALVAEGRVAIAAAVLAVLVGGQALRYCVANWRGFLVLGFFNAALPFGLISYAEVTITASLGSLLNATVPMFAAIVAAVWLRQRLTAKRGAAIAIGFAGVFVVVGWSPIELTTGSLLAVAAMLGATSGYAIGLTYARRRFHGVAPMTQAVGQLAAATVILAPLAAVTMPASVVSLNAIGSIMALAVLCTAVAWPLLFRLLARVGPTATATVTFLVPIFGIAWGAIFLGESIGPELLAGSVLIAVSLALIFDARLPAFARIRPIAEG